MSLIRLANTISTSEHPKSEIVRFVSPSYQLMKLSCSFQRGYNTEEHLTYGILFFNGYLRPFLYHRDTKELGTLPMRRIQHSYIKNAIRLRAITQTGSKDLVCEAMRSKDLNDVFCFFHPSVISHHRTSAFQKLQQRIRILKAERCFLYSLDLVNIKWWHRTKRVATSQNSPEDEFSIKRLQTKIDPIS